MKMKTLCSILSLCALPAMAGGKAPSCSNIPVSIEIGTFSNDPSAPPYGIVGDLQGPYVDGQSGVSALIYVCTSGGSAQLQLSNSPTRTIGFSLAGKRLAANNSTPAWTSGSANSPIYSKAYIQVRNLVDPTAYLAGNPGPSSFTTTLGTSFSGPERKIYFLNFVNPCADRPYPGDHEWLNTPFTTSRVVVQHSGAVGTSSEQWDVYPDITANSCALSASGPASAAGTLIQSQGSGMVNEGQFQSNFHIVIRRK